MTPCFLEALDPIKSDPKSGGAEENDTILSRKKETIFLYRNLVVEKVNLCFPILSKKETIFILKSVCLSAQLHLFSLF